MDLCGVETKPLAQENEYLRMSYSSDNLCISSSTSSSIANDLGGVEESQAIISNHPKPEKFLRMSADEFARWIKWAFNELFWEIHFEFFNRSNLTFDSNFVTSNPKEEGFDHFSEEDDEDQITNYLQNLRIDADQVTPSLSFDSGPHMSRSSRTSSVLSEEDKLSEAASTTTTEDFTCDDCAKSKEHNGVLDGQIDKDSLPSECDYTVKGVAISEFTSAERFRYLQRSRSDEQTDFLQNKATDFCINI